MQGHIEEEPATSMAPKPWSGGRRGRRRRRCLCKSRKPKNPPSQPTATANQPPQKPINQRKKNTKNQIREKREGLKEMQAYPSFFFWVSGSVWIVEEGRGWSGTNQVGFFF